jgi:hypothetical protein
MYDEWWKFWRTRPALFHAVGRGFHFSKHPKGWKPEQPRFPKVMIAGRVSKYFNPVRIQNRFVYHEKTVVFSSQSIGELALMNSSIVDAWIRRQSSTLGETMNFAPSDAILSLPSSVPLLVEQRQLFS